MNGAILIKFLRQCLVPTLRPGTWHIADVDWVAPPRPLVRKERATFARHEPFNF
jgi:hypothetical protein